MDDNHIIQLYWDRNDQAVRATSDKYGRYCKTIAKNILNNEEDAEECLNDTWLHAWNSMPAHWPAQLAAFLGKITRNLSFNRYKHNHAKKRGGGEIMLILDELADCVSDVDTVEQIIEQQDLVKEINSFVRNLSQDKRNLFVRRYWYADSISDIAKDYGMLQGTVSKKLERTRKQLKAYLTERGFEL
ncbi:MAG: sigma-70 family RNA polymerase sigma factor [Lachnospiraceae bacterium]|nr:sigma-70 family RNA polymerase sigma factor [Lachnospiraceae bacterium]